MTTKRPPVDLMALTSEQAAPMPEATQRAPTTVVRMGKTARKAEPAVATADLEALAFKVPPAFRKRFRERAVAADLKLNALLFEALDAWEEKRGFKR